MGSALGFALGIAISIVMKNPANWLDFILSKSLIFHLVLFQNLSNVVYLSRG
jgi:hypothetical protein